MTVRYVHRLWVVRYVLSASIMSGLSGCGRESVNPDATPIVPVVRSINVLANPHNVLSVLVNANVDVSDAAVVFVEYGIDSLHLETTPVHPMLSTPVGIPVVGLRPDTGYFFRAGAISSTGNVVRTSFQAFTTGMLPEDIPQFTLLAHDRPTSGFVAIGLNSSGPSYAVILDNNADIVMYRRFDGAVSDFQKQPDGRYTVWAQRNDGPARFHELDIPGNVVREYQATSAGETGPHELRLVPEGHILFGVEYRTMDLTAHGGLANAIVRGLIVEYVAPQPFQWSTFDHFAVTDAASDISLAGANVNPWHGNAIDVDTDGNLLVSFRNMDEVTKIAYPSGEILWRLGGENNQFTFINDPLNGFSHQHGIRRLPNGNIILFDNGNLHNPPASRAVEYLLDETTRTATMVWEYRPSPPIFSAFLGFAQRLANGNTLVCFGNTRRITEVDASGVTRWEVMVDGTGRQPYRAFRISSLY